jgi:hypothetical protein
VSMSKVNWLKTIVYNFLIFVVVVILGTNTLTLLINIIDDHSELNLLRRFVNQTWDTFGHTNDPTRTGAWVLTQLIFIPIISFIIINLGYYLITKKSIFRKY